MISDRETARLQWALVAIQARVQGEYDNPALQWFGPLTTSTRDDVVTIAQWALQSAPAPAEWAAV